MYLIFDTETTGLPRNWKAPVTDTNNWPRMVQIAWHLYDHSGNLISKNDFIIKPEGFTIPRDVSRLHGITTEMALRNGNDLESTLNIFNELIDKANSLVARNMRFDEKIVGAEFIRKSIRSSLFKKSRLCTMNASTSYCCLPWPYGYKWPKLSELH